MKYISIIREIDRSKKRVWYKSLVVKISKIFYMMFRKIDINKFSERVNELGLECKDDNSKYIASLTDPYTSMRQSVFLRSEFDDILKMKFESLDVPVCGGYHNVLTQIYGDYMKLPPEEKRKTHHAFRAYAPIETCSYYDRDLSYWNNFYRNCSDIEEPSLFAEFIIQYLKQGSNMLELGCGNGRDTLFFAKNNINVTAIDASDIVISKLSEKYSDGNIFFVCDDFVSYSKTYREGFDYCYSRFSIHAINHEQESEVIHNVYNALKTGGMFFIETRSVNDNIYGLGEQIAENTYIYQGHFRRFIVLEELKSKLVQAGFSIMYAEEKEGFAPFGNDDPEIIRIIAKR